MSRNACEILSDLKLYFYLSDFRIMRSVKNICLLFGFEVQKTISTNNEDFRKNHHLLSSSISQLPNLFCIYLQFSEEAAADDDDETVDFFAFQTSCLSAK